MSTWLLVVSAWLLLFDSANSTTNRTTNQATDLQILQKLIDLELQLHELVKDAVNQAGDEDHSHVHNTERIKWLTELDRNDNDKSAIVRQSLHNYPGTDKVKRRKRFLWNGRKRPPTTELDTESDATEVTEETLPTTEEVTDATEVVTVETMTAGETTAFITDPAEETDATAGELEIEATTSGEPETGETTVMIGETTELSGKDFGQQQGNTGNRNGDTTESGSFQETSEASPTTVTSPMVMIDMLQEELTEPDVTPSGVAKGSVRGRGKGRGKARTYMAPNVDRSATKMRNGRLQFGPQKVKSKKNPHTGDKEKKIQNEQQHRMREHKLAALQAQNPNIEYPPLPPMDSEAKKRDLEDAGTGDIQAAVGEWENSLSRKKRSILKDANFRWVKGIIPYMFEATNTEEQIAEYYQSMSRYQFHTCIKFVQYNDTTQQDYGLNHNNYLHFLQNGVGCWSYVGNVYWWNGQSMSCCKKWACVHELGHAFGMKHEQTSPLRDDWIRVRWENLSPAESKLYQKVDPSQFIQERYDLSSDMHYDFGTSMLTLDPHQAYLLTVSEEFYYMFKSLSEAYGCQASSCPDSVGVVCANDGYYSLYDGRCQCICPPGLDPMTNCQQPIANADSYLKTKSWPGGTYAILKPHSGCPSSEWVTMETGTSTHLSNADILLSPRFSSAGAVSGNSISFQYCVKNNQISKESDWPRGMYCVLKAGTSCPSGFSIGSVGFADSASPSSTGTTSDLNLTTKTDIKYCCREDGGDEDPVAMPTQSSFILFQKGSAGCQMIRDMTVWQQYYTFTNTPNSVVITYGSTPYIIQTSDTTTVYMCYYEPISYGCGAVYDLNPDTPVVTFTSPNYPADYDNQHMCTWLIKGPTGTKLKLMFDAFNVEQPSDGNGCWDTVEIRDNYLGQGGHRYCGDGFASSVLTNFNTLMVILHTNYEGTRTGFNATVKLLTANNSCYNLDDEGASYRGSVNYTVDFDICLPWAQMVHCRHYSFRHNDLHDGLDENFCRNPGHGSRPWCYIASDGCIRNYCDVCQLQESSDFDDTCAEELLVDPLYCKSTRAFRFCQKICNLTADNITLVLDISCQPLTIPADSQLVSGTTLATSYRVGDQVKYECKNDASIVQVAVCLTDRTWSTQRYTCGGCSSGWTNMNGYCYKFYEEFVLYPDAVARCAESGANVSTAKDQAEMDLLDVLRDTSPLIWLGATYEVTQRTWLWTDRSNLTFNYWATGQPDNYNNMEHCVYMNSVWNNNTWHDVYCQYYNYYAFVCKKTITANRILCADQIDMCDETIRLNPDACSLYYSFANQVCAMSCQRCGWAPTCNVTIPFGNVTSSLVTDISTGSHIQYNCFPNYVHISGDLKRACMKCGQLTGEMPYCIALQQSIWPSNQASIQRRSKDSWPMWAFTADNENMMITRRGNVVAWHFYSGNEGTITFHIYKVLLRQPDRSMMVEIVGVTSIVVKYDREYYHELNGTQQITVEPGYLIGLNFDIEAGVLQYDSCNADVNPEAQDWKYGFFFDPVGVGQTWLFSHFSPCRIYSVAAIIGPA